MRKPAKRPTRPRLGGTEKFERVAPVVMQALIDRYKIEAFQAAGILGNLGRESDGLTALREWQFKDNPDRGGYGWAQWTGPRAHEFHKWCAQHSLDWRSDAANIGFLLHELDGPYHEAVEVVRKTTSVAGATRAFEAAYEKAGVPAMADRISWANLALQAYRRGGALHA